MTDIEIVTQIGKELNVHLIELKQKEFGEKGYEVDQNKNVISIHLYQCGLINLDKIFNYLAKLNYLEELNISNSQLKDISRIKKLKKLKSFVAVENEIRDISPLKELKKLQRLHLRNNMISDISSLEGLTSLEELGIGGNLTIDISCLENLINLKKLYLWEVNLTSLFPLQNLRKLVYLNVRENKIKDIQPLKNLTDLKHIDLKHNLIEELPPWTAELSIDIKIAPAEMRESEPGIFVQGNPLKSPPLEIVKKGNEAIKAWFKGKRVSVNEVKVLLVGHGEVGKTTLVKCLTGEKPNPKEKSTHHIKIRSYPIKSKNKEIKLNFWDFGGQEVMHSTHQFFLSKRSIYLLVLDGRRDEDAEYWLKHIESFGGNSPVLIVLNKIDANPSYDLDRRFLLKKYPFIYGFYKTACFTRMQGLSELKKSLISALDDIEILREAWPESWAKVKIELEEMKQDYISQSSYSKICEANGIFDEVDKETLASFLNDLGVVVHFKDLRLSDLHILQPRWASRAAYKIINAEKVSKNHGLLKCEWLPEIMKKSDKNDFIYPITCFPYILDLMQKFELCYSIKENKEYLIPELMDIQQPKLPEHKGAILKFYIQFEDLLPRSIIARFIVRMHEDIKDDLRWRTGVVLSIDIFKSLAIIIADVKERKINITVSGPRRREHFAIIRKTFNSLVGDFEKLAVSSWIPLPDNDNFAIEYDELIGYEEASRADYFVGKLRKSYRVKDLLDGIEHESTRKDEYRWDVFLCHSSKDKEVIRKIANDLKQKGISYWLDEEQIKPGNNIIDKITDGLQNSRHILPCISANQLRSGWSKNEYQAILQGVISGTTKQTIIPLILDDTSIDEIPLFMRNYRGEKYLDKDSYGVLISHLHENRNRGIFISFQA